MTRLVVLHPFTASLALCLEIVPVRDSRIGTAATDGRHVFFDVAFACSLSADERLFVLAHEVWHCAVRHAERRGSREHRLWGLAADGEVNHLLAQDGFTAPGHAVRFPRLEGASAEQIYEWLTAERRRASGLTSFDVHLPDGLAAGSGDSDWIEDPDCTPARADDLSVQALWSTRLAEAVEQARQRGTLPAGLECLVRKLEQAGVPWQTVLRGFVHRALNSGQRSFSRPSRRHVWRGAWLPGPLGERVRLAVAIDTSGSTSRALHRFLTEVAALASEFSRIQMTVIECDCAVHRVTVINEWDGPTWIEKACRQGLRGGGGTDFRPAFEAAALHAPDALLYFTDGWGVAPTLSPHYPVLWVLAGEDAQRPVPWGSTLGLPARPVG